MDKIHMLMKQGKKVGFTCSTFDLLHAGHVLMLQESKRHCDYLVVGLLSDPTISRPEAKNKPVQTMYERYLQLQAIEAVDEIIPFDSEKDLENMLLTIKPNIRFVGEEYAGRDFTGSWIKEIEVFFNSRKHDFSTSKLRDRVGDA